MKYYIGSNDFETFKVTITHDYYFQDFFDAMKFALMFKAFPVISGTVKWNR